MARFNPYAKYQAICVSCGGTTTGKYAREHVGLCKYCTERKAHPDSFSNTPTREQRILEHGYQAYAREEGHYDQGDY
jgi:reverse gyrase